MKAQLWASLAMLALVEGCASVPECDDVQRQPKQITERLENLSAYDAHKDQLKNDVFGTRLDYHQLVLAPRELVEGAAGGSHQSSMNLSMPIYFIGIEKIGNHPTLHVDKSCKGHGFDIASIAASMGNDPDSVAGKKAYEAACQVLDDGKPLLLTHIARSDGIISGRYQLPCLLYSVYPGGQRCAQVTPVPGEGTTPYNYEAAISAISALRRQVEESVAKHRPTHLLVMSTGWNTQQDESLYNYVDWLDGIQKAAGASGEFRPLVVAFTWQSGFDRLPKGLGVVTKGNDADEVGLTWANRVVNDVVLPVAMKMGTPVAMIGHSYGTRVIGTAVFDRMALNRDTDIAGSGMVPIAFIALQPALPVQRFSLAGKEPFYANGKSMPILMVLTSSRHDEANSMLDRYWGTYAGGGQAIPATRLDSEFRHFQYVSVKADGSLLQPLDRRGHYFVDSSEMTICKMPNTGGGAHSDVFDLPAGNFMWEVIKAL